MVKLSFIPKYIKCADFTIHQIDKQCCAANFQTDFHRTPFYILSIVRELGGIEPQITPYGTSPGDFRK